MGRVAEILSLWGRKLLPIIAGVCVLPASVHAITMDQCSRQFGEFVQAANDVYGEQYSQEMQNELLNTGPINFAFINSFRPEEAADLAENAKVYREVFGAAAPDPDPDVARVKRAEVATISCIYEKKIAELSTNGRARGDGYDPEMDIAETGVVETGRSARLAGSVDGYDYDDFDHGRCVEVEALPPGGSGSEMAYGHFLLKNTCAYPLKLLTCFAFDRADGSASPNYDRHAEGEKCPGMGWGGTTLGPNEERDVREWYEYNNIKWEVKACQDGWDFVGRDGKYPAGILGEEYRCRRYAG